MRPRISIRGCVPTYLPTYVRRSQEILDDVKSADFVISEHNRPCPPKTQPLPTVCLPLPICKLLLPTSSDYGLAVYPALFLSLREQKTIKARRETRTP